MFIIIGLIALLGAVAVGVAAVQANSGSSHAVPNGFTVFDHNYGGSTGLLFAYGILVGVIGTCGLILLLAGTWTTSRRGMVARRELRHSRREMAAARKELTKPGMVTEPARTVEPPSRPVVPMAKATPKRSFSMPTWSPNRFLNRPAGPANPESVAK
ncbi:hypothetical protein [Nocardia sp. NBC_00511]|uniref:hypothetical protein n=1 Tax=Nocardia sp. NBC_00511 TaxID=2903591 RepID=UPI0030E5BD2C